MALVAGNWYKINVGALSTGTNPLPQMSGFVLDAIDTASEILVYCIADGAVSQIAYDGGRSAVQDAMVTINSTPTKLTTVWDGGDTWVSVRRVDGALVYWSERQGSVETLTDPTDLSDLAAFLS